MKNFFLFSLPLPSPKKKLSFFYPAPTYTIPAIINKLQIVGPTTYNYK